MRIYKLETGNFKMDGGATFGVVPKSLWHKMYPADDNNMCNFSSRSLLLVTDKRCILIDTGIGRKQSDKFLRYYYLNGEATLEKSLLETGFTKEDITDIILTHLHFDHCGGVVERDQQDNLKLAFPNAKVWISRTQWEWAMHPNPREKASFLPENYSLLEKSGRLHFIETSTDFDENIQLRLYNGHTEGLIVPFIRAHGTTLVFTTDLLPTTAHVPVSWVCGFDTQPLVSMEEKISFLREAMDNKYILLFQHDIFSECCNLKKTEKGIRMDRSFRYEEIENYISIQTP